MSGADQPQQRSSEDRPRKKRWVPGRGFFALIGYSVFSLVLVAGLLEVAAFGLLKIRHGSSLDSVSPIAASPSFVGVPWAAEFLAEERARWREQRSSYVPFRLWGVAPWHGKYINTDDTVSGTWRRTTNVLPARCAAQRVTKLWILGGSTVYGTGVPDWGTLPSYLSSVLNSGEATCVDVANLGVEGYVTNQELILVMEKLKAGARPDLVVFYDGMNESLVGAVSPGIATAHASLDAVQAGVENTLRNKLDFLFRSYAVRLTRRLLGRSADTPSNAISSTQLAERAQATIANYQANLALVRLLADAYHFKFYSFWQPTLYCGKKKPDPFERELMRGRDIASGSGFGRGIAAVCSAAERRANTSANFVFLGGVFDGVTESIYLDTWMHLSPHGNEMVARAIARRLEIGN